MSKSVAVPSVANALDSLVRLEQELRNTSPENPVTFKGVLAWGWHATVLLVYMRLLPARDQLDPWLWDYVTEGELALDLERDAWWEDRQRLSLLEMIDILSETESPILKPEFYQGWQDRTTRCQTLRSQAASVIGSSIGPDQRDGLLWLLAAYHRLLRLPVAVELAGEPIAGALPHLFDLMESLVDPTAAAREALVAAIGRARAALTEH